MNPFQEGNRFYACGMNVTVREDESGETHVYRTSDGFRLTETDLKFGTVFGGGRNGSVSETCVRMESGFLKDLYGGGEGGTVEKSVKVSVSGGMIGRYLCGGGVDDEVGDILMKVTGGAVKYGLFAAGFSLRCNNIFLDFDGILCTNVRTWGKNPALQIKGKTTLNMHSGHIFDLSLGALHHEGDVQVNIFGGQIEKQITNKCEVEKVHIKLYRNLFESDGEGGFFPGLPRGADITFLPEISKGATGKRIGDDSAFFEQRNERGKLVFRFFSLSHPDMPRESTSFPAFIGDSFLISFPNGEMMLVDTGMPYSYEEISQGLALLGIKKLDYLMITHPHDDHIGNAVALLKELSVSQLWLPDAKMDLFPSEAEMQKALIETAAEKGVLIRKVGRGDVFEIGKGEKLSRILILNPEKRRDFAADLNGYSIACKVTYKDSSAVLCGDITDEEEEQIAKIYGAKLETDLLKISHHGIVYQNFYTFIDACNPKVAVAQNLRDRGVFIKTTAYALEKVNGLDPSALLVTGRHGKIKVILDGKKGDCKIHTEFS